MGIQGFLLASRIMFGTSLNAESGAYPSTASELYPTRPTDK